MLRLEDRREYDPAIVQAWLTNPNPLHRKRMALAVGRISPQSESHAGATALAAIIADPEREVRETVAFSLGEIGDLESVEPLFTLAGDADASVAAEAIEALSKLAPKTALSRYVPFTQEPQPEGVRTRAIRFLFRWNSDEASMFAANALASPSSAIRQASAYALARRAFPPARERLELLVNDADVLTRAYVASALGRIAAPQSIAVLTAMFTDAHPWVRTNAVVALGRIATKDHNAIVTPDLAQDALRVMALIDDPDPGVRASAIDTLGWYAAKNDAAKARLQEIFTGGSRSEREIAAGAIVRNNPQMLLSMPNLTGWQKVRGLQSLPPDADAIRAAFAKDDDPNVRANALSTIADDHCDANVSWIRPMLDDRDVIVRANAIDRYMHTKHPDPELFSQADARARSDSQNDARLAALIALAQTGNHTAVRWALTDDDPVVRRQAADEIENTFKEPRPSYTPLPVDRSDYAQIVEWSRHPHTATIHMTRGRIEMQLLTSDAPITTWNFAQLAKSHYFDNSTFMRVVPNFVIQGGDPRNDMNGGPGYAIRDEINLQKYTRAAAGMALSGPDTGGSQFFITHSPQPHLDGGYTIFGRVTDGMNAVVDQTERGDKVETVTIQ
ncbi:MAG TPA: HEAT repeat domain-containing protein [Thermoanaerobaculia bacterium]|nr:HEAT repeat domain-containing protein [Thermoanaerobaculia bacterium]